MIIPTAFIYELAAILWRARGDAQYIAQRELIEDTIKQVARCAEAFRVMSSSDFYSIGSRYRPDQRGSVAGTGIGTAGASIGAAGTSIYTDVIVNSADYPSAVASLRRVPYPRPND